MEVSSSVQLSANQPDKHVNRTIGTYSKNLPGPTVVCICGMHGNEPSGLNAFEQVIERLKETQVQMKGKIIGIMGNISAFNNKERFNQHDLNRLWTSENILSMAQNKDHRTYQDAIEQREVYAEISKLLAEESHPYFFIDLHTTSSESQPYISINDTLRNRAIALKYPLPIVLGLEEHLQGTILSYINLLGHISLGFEAGQHDDPRSIINHKAIIWLTLHNTGCLSNKSEWENNYELLARNMSRGKKVFEVRHRQAIQPEEQFKMKAGYTNFQRIEKGESLAMTDQGPIKSPKKGLIFMPLYQSKGDDGFFIIRRVKWFWLTISKVLRQSRFHRFLYLLPGVHRFNNLTYTLVINKRIAKWYVVEFFHLMGFRMKRKHGHYIIFTKRKFDVNEPY